MYNAIKNIYPAIKDSEFALQDNADGQGVFIARWSYAQAKPTQAQLDAVDLFPVAEFKNAFMLKIDAGIDAIYAKVVGNRFAEYQDAATEAKAFKDTLYLGTAGTSVTSWATVKAKTNQWAADDILATATAWKGVQAQMRSVRLAHKEQARNASVYAQLAPIEASWAGTLTAIKTALGIA